jgi:hypothetical protein
MHTVHPHIPSKGHVKVKLSLCLIKGHAMKTYGGVELQLHVVLTSTLHGSGQLHAAAALPAEEGACKQCK